MLETRFCDLNLFGAKLLPGLNKTTKIIDERIEIERDTKRGPERNKLQTKLNVR